MDTMSVVRTGMAMQGARLAQQLGAAVATKVSDQQEAEGAMAIRLIEASAVAASPQGYSPGQMLNVEA